MDFVQRAFRTFYCVTAGWLTANVILLAVLLANQVTLHDAFKWPYETGKVTFFCWLFFGLPLAAFDEGRSWFSKWTSAFFVGGVLGVISLAVFLHGFIGLTISGLANWPGLGLYAIAFVIGAVPLGLYYR